jgi:hypothetical protein
MSEIKPFFDVKTGLKKLYFETIFFIKKIINYYLMSAFIDEKLYRPISWLLNE